MATTTFEAAPGHLAQDWMAKAVDIGSFPNLGHHARGQTCLIVDTGALYVYDGKTTWYAVPGASGLIFDGSGYLKVAEQYAPAYEDNTNAVAHSEPSFSTEWHKFHLPATNVKATVLCGASGTAPGAGKRFVIRGMTVKLCAGAAAPTAIQLTVDIVEDAAGTPTTVCQFYIAIPATAGYDGGFVKSDWHFIQPTQNKTLTVQFSAAGGANTYESVEVNGYIITG